MSKKRETPRKAKLVRLDPEVADALEVTAKLSGLSENKILNYAVSNALASIHPENNSLANFRTFAGAVTTDTSGYVSQVKDDYAETISLLSGKEVTE